MKKFNAVGWFDINVENMDRAVQFYEAVLGTELSEIVDPTGESKMMSFAGDMQLYGAGGSLVQSKYAKPGVGGTVVYFSVEDCKVEEEKVAHSGGKVIRPKFSIGDYGWVTLCEDTEGNMFGLSSMK